MIDQIDFALAVLVVLSVPGPTNTLLALGGAANGWHRGLSLIPAVLAGYLLSTITLATALSSAATLYPELALGVRIACGLYLCYIALSTWKSTVKRELLCNGRDVFITTLLNPKNFVLAFGVFPISSDARGSFSAYITIFIGLCILVTSTWMLVGASLRSESGSHNATVQRVGAVILALFAGGIFVSAFAQQFR
jgi:threonine/homoserine/homoserine lactone efflux protein